MIINGTMYIIDSTHIDILKQNLATTSPPMEGGMVAGTVMCLDLDEEDRMLELWYPYHCQILTVLLPPPNAVYKIIDGDQEEFIKLYTQYLEEDDCVQDSIANILYFLSLGGNIMMYIPSAMVDDAIWVNVLMTFFYTRYGITIGTSDSLAAYDPRYDSENAIFMYSRGKMNVLDFIRFTRTIIPDDRILHRLQYDLLQYCGPNETPMDVYNKLLESYIAYGPNVRPGLIFENPYGV